MEIDYTNKSAAIHFIKQYDEGLKLGLYYIEKLFDKNVTCNLHIYHHNIVDTAKGGSFDTTELTGYETLKDKLTSLGIMALNLNQYTFSSQLTGYNILLTINGTLSINQKPFTFTNTLILKYVAYNYIIVNYILQIYL